MRKSRSTEEPIIGIMNVAQADEKVGDLWKKRRISEHTFYRRRVTLRHGAGSFSRRPRQSTHEADSSRDLREATITGRTRARIARGPARRITSFA
jgi:hypothetical protein